MSTYYRIRWLHRHTQYRLDARSTSRRSAPRLVRRSKKRPRPSQP